MTATLDSFLGTGWPEELPPHISASQIVTWERCPELWRIRYLDRKKAPPAGYLILGSADHETFEENFRRKIDTGEDMSVSDCQLLFAENLDRLVDEAGEVDWESSTKDKTKDLGVQMVTAYRLTAAPQVRPIAVEQKVEIEVPDAPVPIVGYVDVEEETGLLERKTSARKWSTPTMDKTIQARIYQAALPKPARFHVTTKTKTPAVYTPAEEPGLELSPDPEETGRVLRYAAATIRGILAYYQAFGPEGPWPGARGRRDSTCAYCGFRAKHCRWWS